MELIRCKFWCNSGHTEEEVEFEIDSTKNEENQIQEEFQKWLDNNENVGWSKITNA